jgi:hypothetical protein
MASCRGNLCSRPRCLFTLPPTLPVGSEASGGARRRGCRRFSRRRVRLLPLLPVPLAVRPHQLRLKGRNARLPLALAVLRPSLSTPRPLPSVPPSHPLSRFCPCQLLLLLLPVQVARRGSAESSAGLRPKCLTPPLTRLCPACRVLLPLLPPMLLPLLQVARRGSAPRLLRPKCLTTPTFKLPTQPLTLFCSCRVLPRPIRNRRPFRRRRRRRRREPVSGSSSSSSTRRL